jgi:hypothetical protein
MLSQKLNETQEANDTVRRFIRRFEVGKLLRICRANKEKGFPVVELFTYGNTAQKLSSAGAGEIW